MLDQLSASFKIMHNGNQFLDFEKRQAAVWNRRRQILGKGWISRTFARTWAYPAGSLIHLRIGELRLGTTGKSRTACIFFRAAAKTSCCPIPGTS